MALSLGLARLFSTQLSVSRICRPAISPWLVPVANKQSAAEELGLPPPPKRPASAYLRWLDKNRGDYRRRNPNLSFLEVTRNLGDIWNNLELNEKDKWAALYRTEKVAFDKRYEDYLKRLTPDQIDSIKKLKRKRIEDKAKRQIKRDKKKDREEFGRPKYPGNAFTMYMLTLDRGGQMLKDFLQDAATRWKKLPEAEANYFREKAARERELYKKDLHEWELKMIRQGRSDLVRQHHQLEDLKRPSINNIRFPDE